MVKTLTDIAVRLRVISTSLLSILGFIALGVVIGYWLGYRSSPATRTLATENQQTASVDPVPDIKWCDSTHKVPFIPAARCGGGSSCDRAFFLTAAGKAPADWNAFCANINKQLQ